jgi:hypothetical protein
MNHGITLGATYDVTITDHFNFKDFATVCKEIELRKDTLEQRENLAWLSGQGPRCEAGDIRKHDCSCWEEIYQFSKQGSGKRTR